MCRCNFYFLIIIVFIYNFELISQNDIFPFIILIKDMCILG